MKASVSRILLPITDNLHFAQTADKALHLAMDFGAEITLLSIDDDSRPYETVSLPFHDGDFVANVLTGDELPDLASHTRVDRLLLMAADRGVPAKAAYVRGHTASQTLLVSRFYDLIATSANPWPADEEQATTQRVNPLIEILDQTVVPVLMIGTGTRTGINSAAVLFDGGPCATLALHSLATLLSHHLDIPIFVRVSMITEAVARELAENAKIFLSSKGFRRVHIEYSSLAPMDAMATGQFAPVDLSALGIRSRNTFHDLHVGILAKHLIENPQSGHTLLC